MATDTSGAANTSNLITEPIEFIITKAAVLTIIGVVAFFGNLMVVLSITIPKKMRSPTNYLLLHLALLDIITVTVRLPMHLMNIMQNRQVLSNPLCQFHAFITGICFIGSVYC